MTGYFPRALCSLLAVAVLAGCAGTRAPIASEEVDYTYKRYRITWRHDGAFVQFRYKVKDEGGKVAVCGAFAESPGGRMSDFTVQLLERGNVTIDGDRVLSVIDFLADHGQEPSLAGRSARCVVTDEPWLPAYSAGKARLNFPSGGYRTT